MIPDVQVEEVRAHADLVDVIGELVPLKKSGKEFKANCPFHEERTPSFYVVPAKGFYKCFGCDESGDVFSFVMKRLGLDFVEAVRYVAAQLLGALQFVHRAGLLHRDVKPDNVLVRSCVEGSGSEVVLADFGLCCSLQESCKLQQR